MKLALIGGKRLFNTGCSLKAFRADDKMYITVTFTVFRLAVRETQLLETDSLQIIYHQIKQVI